VHALGLYQNRSDRCRLISWSRNGRYLATSSKDWKVNIWDLGYTFSNMPDIRYHPEAGSSKATSTATHPFSELHYSFTLDCPLTNAEFHPQTSRVLLVTSTVNEVILVRLREELQRSDNGLPMTNEVDGIQQDGSMQSERPRKRRRVSRGHEVLYLQAYSREEAIQSARETATTSRSQPTERGQEEESTEEAAAGLPSGALSEIDLSLFGEAPSSRESAS
jgi:WD40 repeat protein